MGAEQGGRPAAGGGRWVEVAPDRFDRWLAGFAERHGPWRASGADHGPVVTAADGAVAECHLPFPPAGGFVTTDDPLAVAHDHLAVERTVGVLLVRRGGHAAGVFRGGRLLASKVDSSYVQGRTKAGGWSQQRYARRRAGQTDRAVADAADVAARVLTTGALDALVLGGDRTLARAVLDDPRLAPLRPLVVERFLPVGDPRHAVLAAAPAAFDAVRIRLLDP